MYNVHCCVNVIGYEKSHEAHREHAQPPVHLENAMDQPQHTVDDIMEPKIVNK